MLQKYKIFGGMPIINIPVQRPCVFWPSPLVSERDNPFWWLADDLWFITNAPTVTDFFVGWRLHLDTIKISHDVIPKRHIETLIYDRAACADDSLRQFWEFILKSFLDWFLSHKNGRFFKLGFKALFSHFIKRLKYITHIILGRFYNKNDVITVERWDKSCFQL